MNKELHFEGVAVHAGLVAVIIEIDVADNLLADITCVIPGLVASCNCHKKRQPGLDNFVDTIANLSFSAAVKFVSINAGLDVVVVNLLHSVSVIMVLLISVANLLRCRQRLLAAQDAGTH